MPEWKFSLSAVRSESCDFLHTGWKHPSVDEGDNTPAETIFH